VPPSRLAAVLFGQVFIDQIPHVGEGRKLHDGGDSQRTRRWARPVGVGARVRLMKYKRSPSKDMPLQPRV
jgi:hypothetical protein